MERLKLSDLRDKTDWEEAVIVFTEDSFTKLYSLESRSYKVRRNWGKYFDSTQIGKSLYGECLDGTDECLRLDLYLGNWKVEYCYITK